MDDIIITEDNYILLAAKYYENISCYDQKEFFDDLKRIKYIKRLFNRYKQTGELKTRLILNHLVILGNVFGLFSLNLMLLKLDGYHSYLKPFLKVIGLWPIGTIVVNNKIIDCDIIESDEGIEFELKEI